MNKNLDSYVNNSTGRNMLPPTARRGTEVDPQRAMLAKGLSVPVKGGRPATAANSAQQRQNQDSTRRALLKNEERNAFEGSEYPESTTSGHTQVQVGDSQLDDLGRPIRYVAGGQHAYVEEEGSYRGEESTDEDGEDEEGYEDDRAAPPNANEELASTINYIHSQPDVFGRHMKGDSMPPTTSGEPSHKGDEHQSAQAPFVSQMGGTITIRPPQHGSRNLLQPEPPVHHTTSRTKPAHQFQQPTQTTTVPSRVVQPHQGSTPTRTPVPVPMPTAANLNARSAQQPVQNRQNTSHKPGATQPPTYSQANPDQRAQTQLGHQAEHPNARSNSGTSTKSQSVARTMQPAAAIEEPNVHDVSLFRAALDSNEKTLYKMEYTELHGRSLDNDPAPQPSVLTEHDLEKPLPEQLTIVQQLETKQKEEYMASLSLEQWEEAGDWFLERFGDIVQQLKNARKERRHLAKGFGDVIHDRHQHVQNKKRSIEDSLKEMGKNGANVLTAGTPQKKQKKRRV